MPHTTAAPARVCVLDGGYRREARALLYNVYRNDPTFAYLFDAQRPGFERRLRTLIREWVRQHFYLQLPAVGLLLEDRLIGVALIVPPLRRLGVADSWAWRLRMMLGAGVRCTRRFMDYQAAIATCMPSDQLHVLPLLGVQAQHQGTHYPAQLLQAVQEWCAQDTVTEGVVVDTGNEHHLAFYQSQGYAQIGEVAVGPIRQRVFLHANPTAARAASL
ncbi:MULTISPECIES: hypothetical protein [Pseudomonas]|uniref:hypothetical protein n=1 Tax=Pseudomonas TaxID=286 RepID=UPI000417E339|nr:MULTISPECIES: hypothetical protein [Pseudomonas]